MNDLKSIKHHTLIVAVLALLATWGLKVFLLDNVDRELNFQEQTNQRVQAELERMQVQLEGAVNHISQSKSFRDYHINTDYPYFVYFQDSIIYWSDFHYVPDYQLLDTDKKHKFVDDKDFQFISQRMIVPGTGKCRLYASTVAHCQEWPKQLYTGNL